MARPMISMPTARMAASSTPKWYGMSLLGFSLNEEPRISSTAIMVLARRTMVNITGTMSPARFGTRRKEFFVFSVAPLTFMASTRITYWVLVGTVPAALIGFLFKDFFASEVRSPWVVVLNLVFVGLVLLVAEAVGRRILSQEMVYESPNGN